MIRYKTNNDDTAARIRDKGAELTIAIIWMLNTIFANEKLKGLFTPRIYDVIEFDQGQD